MSGAEWLRPARKEVGGVLSLGFLREAPGLDFFSLLRPSGEGGCSGVSVHRNKGARGVSVSEASLLISGFPKTQPE